ncbi:hypothetical protein [Modestobacter versicolor]|uniref:Uncharacterized protein n=1 Tax=Modestobacter versicolor TaxID=429133 RepID=A0A839Y5Z7_9ACTN|nr:hypothetical protein [Modestobacter versicolor]MBB3678155.1 hypothetical protein [Modestobacter versicolor]
MSEPDRRYDDPNGSTAFPGRPLADQPTEVVHPGGADPRYDTVVGGTAPYPSPRPPDTGQPEIWDQAATDQQWDDGTSTQPDYRDAPVLVRRADTLAGLLLLLAGIAAGVSLLVVWVNGGGTGLDLVTDGIDDLGDPQRLDDRDTWEPLAVVFGGAALFVLGLLAFVPAKSHRFLGVLALLVSLVVAAAVLVPLADANWDVQRWAVGGWFTVAVAGLGFLGALKALMTHPRLR